MSAVPDLLRWRRVVLAALLLVAVAPRLDAQACHGMPARGGVAYEFGRHTVGTSHGLHAVWAGRRTALDVGGRIRDVSPTVSGQEAAAGFALVLGSQRYSVCPGLGLRYERLSWDVQPDASVDANALFIRGGVGLGVQLPDYKGLTAAPYVGVHYAFAVMVYRADGPDADPTLTPDTLSHVEIEYGLIGRYRFLIGGIAANRTSESEGNRPALARWIIGLTFAGNPSRRGTPSSPWIPGRRGTESRR
jgi:hypothetical protein